MTNTPTTHNPNVPQYKLIFLGDQSVGKTCILNRYVNDEFTENYQATIGLDFQSKNINLGNQEINILFYDTAGQEKFRSLIPLYTRDAKIILLVYDISSKESFIHLSDWLQELENVKKDEVIFALVGNKSDLKDNRQVTLEEGQKFAEENNFIFQEISAKENEGFSDLFNNKIFEEIKTKFKPEGQQPKSDRNDIVLDKEEKQENTKKRRCC
jgi:small GTP-binding protein